MAVCGNRNCRWFSEPAKMQTGSYGCIYKSECRETMGYGESKYEYSQARADFHANEQKRYETRKRERDISAQIDLYGYVKY